MVANKNFQLVLASQSPRRRQLLEALGLPFRIELPEGDEDHPNTRDIETIIVGNALRKAQSIFSKLKPNEVALGADTLVVIKDKVLGKPKTVSEAHEMISSLSGTKHQVVTGIALTSSTWGDRCLAVKSQVEFHKLTEAEISSYIETKEPYDKAGAYAIQGLSALFIKNVEGSYTNVMGLPIEALLQELAKLLKVSPFDFFEKR
jgi:septum formation protein